MAADGHAQDDAPWRTRIVGYADMDPAALTPHPLNPRRHPQAQAEALDATLTAVGVVQNVVWNRRTGHILDGHERRDLAVMRRQPTVPTTIVDMPEAEEPLVLATFDPLGAMAMVDPDAMDAVLEAARSSEAATRELVQFLATLPAPTAPEGFPEYGEGAADGLTLRCRWTLTFPLGDEDTVRLALRALGDEVEGLLWKEDTAV